MITVFTGDFRDPAIAAQIPTVDVTYTSPPWNWDQIFTYLRQAEREGGATDAVSKAEALGPEYQQFLVDFRNFITSKADVHYIEIAPETYPLLESGFGANKITNAWNVRVRGRPNKEYWDQGLLYNMLDWTDAVLVRFVSKGTATPIALNLEGAEAYDCPAAIIAAEGAASILDPCLGIGTTLRAAQATGIDGYGIEINPRIVGIVESLLGV